MDNNVEFVNAFVQRQKSFIEDLVGKQLILETRVALQEAKIATLESEVVRLNVLTTAPKTKKIITEDF